jgi:hypothetical protein
MHWTECAFRFTGLLGKRIVVYDQRRYKRLRLLIGKLNKERKRQAQKIDILCNDLIAAQRDFIKKLGTISYTANFYKAIVGATDLNNLLCTASKLIKDEIPDANVAFFLREQDNFDVHMFEIEQAINLEKQRIENCFSRELVSNVCKANRICTLEDMFAMGLEGNLVELNRICAATIPLGLSGSSLGFILIYRSSENKLVTDELRNIAAIAPGLSQAIKSCQLLLHPAE